MPSVRVKYVELKHLSKIEDGQPSQCRYFMWVSRPELGRATEVIRRACTLPPRAVDSWPIHRAAQIFAHLELRYHAHEDSDNDNHQEVTEMDLSSLVFAFIPSPPERNLPSCTLIFVSKGQGKHFLAKNASPYRLKGFLPFATSHCLSKGVVVLEAPRVSSDDGSTPGAFSTS